MFYLAETTVLCRIGISTSLKVLKLDNCRGAGIYLVRSAASSYAAMRTVAGSRPVLVIV